MPWLVNARTNARGTLAKGLIGGRWPLELLLDASPALNAKRTLDAVEPSLATSGSESRPGLVLKCRHIRNNGLPRKINGAGIHSESQ
jgi:hypothetical protein